MVQNNQIQIHNEINLSILPEEKTTENVSDIKYIYYLTNDDSKRINHKGIHLGTNFFKNSKSHF